MTAANYHERNHWKGTLAEMLVCAPDNPAAIWFVDAGVGVGDSYWWDGATWLPIGGGGIGPPTEGPGIDIVGTQVGLGGDTVLLYDDGGLPVAEYATITLALAAAAAGNLVWVPQGTFTEDITIPAGVTVASLANGSVIAGTVTLDGDLSHIKGMIIELTANSAGTLVGIIGPDVGIGLVNDCATTITNTGAGDAYGIQMRDGNLLHWNATTKGIATGAGSGYGIFWDGSGNASINGGKVNGSTQDFKGTGSVITGWHFPADFDGWIGFEGSSYGGAFSTQSWNALNGHDAPGCIYVDTEPAPASSNQRWSGIQLTPGAPITVNTGDQLSVWMYKIAEVLAGPGATTNVSRLRINFNDGSSTTAEAIQTVGVWNQIIITISAANDGKVVSTFQVSGISNSQSTAEWYIDDVVLISSSSGQMSLSLCAVELSQAQPSSPSVAVAEWSDRAAWDALAYQNRHANDINYGIHWTEDELNQRYGGNLGWYNPMNYGAYGDGVHDDTIAINDTIAAIPATGGVLYFQFGQYLTTGGFIIDKPIVVYGLTGGYAASINCTSPTAFLFTIDTDHVSMLSLNLYNSAGVDPSAGAGIRNLTGSLNYFENLLISRFYDDISFIAGSVWNINNCYLSSPVRYGIHIANAVDDDAGDSCIDNCVITQDVYTSTAAIHYISSGGLKISNLKINANMGGGFYFQYGILLEGTATTGNFQVTNTSIENVSVSGIRVNQTGGHWEHTILTNIQFGFYGGAGYTAISMSAAVAGQFEEVIIANCIFHGTEPNAIVLTNIDHVRLVGNYNAGFTNLLSQAGCTDVVIIGETLDASDITYTPAVLADWDGGVDPGNADSAFDQLAERIKDLESAPPPVSALDDLTDVDTTGVVDGSALRFDSVLGKWVDSILIRDDGSNVMLGNASDYLNVDTDGTISLVGDARVFREMRVDAINTEKGAAAPTETLRDVGSSGTVKVPVLQFSKITQQDVHFEVHAPSDIDDTEDIYFHLMWFPGAAWSAGNYMWKLEYIITDEDGVELDAEAPTTIQIDATPAAATNVIESECSTSISGLAAGRIIWCHFYRDVANDNADDVGEARVFEFQYTMNKLGEKYSAPAKYLIDENGDHLLDENGDHLTD